MGSRVKLVQEFNCFKDWISSGVWLGKGFIWFKGSIGSMVQLFQGLNWFKVLIGMKVKLVQVFIFVQAFNCFKDSIILRDQLTQCTIVVEV